MKQSFGTEGVTYRYDENGNIRRITVPEDFDIARTDGGGNSRLVGITMYSQDTWLNDTGLEAIKIWAKDDYRGKIPSGITLTPDEGELVSRYKTWEAERSKTLGRSGIFPGHPFFWSISVYFSNNTLS